MAATKRLGGLTCVDSHLFQASYMRNNKHTGQKNLRCFPCCLAEGHNSMQYCGRPVRVRAEFPLAARPEDCLVCASFVDKAGKNTQVHEKYAFHVGDLVKRAHIVAGCRSTETPTRPLIQGSMCGKQDGTTWAFNQGVAGWHYGW